MLTLTLALTMMATTLAQGPERIGIYAETTSFDNERGAMHLDENVRITRGSMEITAEEGYGYRGDNGWRRVELFGSPVEWQTTTEDGGETSGHADEVVYDLGSRTITLIGNAYIEERRGSFSGERLVYNIDSQATEGEGGIRMEIEAEAMEEAEDGSTEPD